jgi:RNA polymerase sigma-70 factor, ECF subfamily
MGCVSIVMIFKKRQPQIDYPSLTDQELVALAKDSGEQGKQAFGELYERYITKIYNYIYYRVGNHHDAEDLAARVFYRAMGHIDSYTDMGVPFQAWLYRIAHNLVANWHRDKGRRKIIPLDEFVAATLKSDAPEQQAEHNEEQQRLMNAVRTLPEERQQLLILKFIENLSNAEISEIMERTEGAIKSLYHRTLLSLRDEMSKAEQAASALTSGIGGRKKKDRA